MKLDINNLVFKGVLLAAAGGCAMKAVQAVRYYKTQKELYETIEEETEDEK